MASILGPFKGFSKQHRVTKANILLRDKWMKFAMSEIKFQHVISVANSACKNLCKWNGTTMLEHKDTYIHMAI